MALGPPGGGPRAMELVALAPPAKGALPGSPGRRAAARGSASRADPRLVAPCRAMNRRDADLCAGRDPSGAAPARSATDLPAMRVLGRGGGGRPLGIGRRRRRRRPGGCLRRRRCLTQRRERQRRVDGATHQLSEGALGRAAGGQRGEHVFGKLRVRSDGTGVRTFRAAPAAADLALRRGRAGAAAATGLARADNRALASAAGLADPGRPGPPPAA